MTAEEKKTETQEVKPQEAKPQETKPKESRPEGTKPQVEKQDNCLSCGKPLKKLRQYYRNGKYYCTKRCWLNYKKKSKEEKKQ